MFALMRDVEMPARIASLPTNELGIPIPWFVRPAFPFDFRVLRDSALHEAWRREICWICGQPLGVYKVYVVGPLSAIQRVSSEAACHRDCADYAMMVCPFIANPKMVRGGRDYPVDIVQMADYELQNPGIYLQWVSREPYRSLEFSYLKLPQWNELIWWKQRRRASREEVCDALFAGAKKLRYSPQYHDPATHRKFDADIAQMHSLIPAE